jgi:hypothetical protein
MLHGCNACAASSPMHRDAVTQSWMRPKSLTTAIQMNSDSNSQKFGVGSRILTFLEDVAGRTCATCPVLRELPKLLKQTFFASREIGQRGFLAALSGNAAIPDFRLLRRRHSRPKADFRPPSSCCALLSYCCNSYTSQHFLSINAGQLTKIDNPKSFKAIGFKNGIKQV